MRGATRLRRVYGRQEALVDERWLVVETAEQLLARLAKENAERFEHRTAARRPPSSPPDVTQEVTTNAR